MYTDSHNHTCHFSSDAEMSISDFLGACRKNNIKRIVITEHYDMDYPHPEEPSQIFDIDQYVEAFAVWKKLCPSDLELNMGIELGWQPHLASSIDKIAASYDFDSIILSKHIFEGKDVFYYPECYKIYETSELHRKYIESLAEMAEKCNNYDIIGHYDYINRYCKKRKIKVMYDDCPEAFDKLFEVIISKNKSLEVNTKSIHKAMQKKTEDYMPDSKILLRYKEMGGKMITLGSDSHTPNTLGIHFDITGEYLKSLGFTDNTYFVKRKPFFEKL